MTDSSLLAIRDEGISLLQSVTRLETFFMALRQAGLSKIIPASPDPAGSENLRQLLQQMQHLEQELDWELTSEIVRLKDLCRERAADYARGQYGLTVGSHIRLPSALPGLSAKLRISLIGFVDDPPHELRLEGNPVRTDGTVLSESIAMLLGPDGIKVHLGSVLKRDELRNRVG